MAAAFVFITINSNVKRQRSKEIIKMNIWLFIVL
jgi:hypothetical protein